MNDEKTQFKEEVLKNIKQFEDNLIKKINQKMIDLNTDYKRFHNELKNISDHNQKLIDSLINKNINIEKLSVLEQFKNKVDSILITHEIRINNNIQEINSIKSKYDKAIMENLMVPGYVGPSCQYKNLGEYIIYSLNEISKMKSEKEMIRNSFKELRIKTDSSMRTVLNLNESLVRRCNDYTDNRVSEFKKIIYEKTDYMNEKEREIKRIAEYFKVEQEIYQKNKNSFENKLKEDIFSAVDSKMDENKNNLEEILNKAKSQNKINLGNFENKIKDVNDTIIEIQNQIKNLNDNDLPMIKKFIQEKQNIRNIPNFPIVPSLSQKAISIFKKEQIEEKTNTNNDNNDNENYKTYSNYNEYNENYKPNKTYSNFPNRNVMKKDESNLQKYNLNNVQLNSEPKSIIKKMSQKNLIKYNFNELEKKNNETQKNNNIEKSIESAPVIYKTQESSDMLLKHKNSKILILHYGQKNPIVNSFQKNQINNKKSFSSNSNSNEFMKNFVNIKTMKTDNINNNNNNNNNKDSDVMDCGAEEDKSPKNLIDELLTPKILEKKILTNEQIKKTKDKSYNCNIKINLKKNLNHSGTDLNNFLVKYHTNFSPKQKINAFKTLDNWKKNSKNWKSERNIRITKDRSNSYNMVNLELKSENNVTNGATVIANKKKMNQHVTKIEFPSSFAALYNVKITNKKSKEKLKV